MHYCCKSKSVQDACYQDAFPSRKKFEMHSSPLQRALLLHRKKCVYYVHMRWLATQFSHPPASIKYFEISGLEKGLGRSAEGFKNKEKLN